MKVLENNISILPFYNSIDKLNHNKSYAYGAKQPLTSNGAGLLPFQVLVAPEKESDRFVGVSNVFLIGVDNNVRVNITNEIQDLGFEVKTLSDSTLIRYPATQALSNASRFPQGLYVLQMWIIVEENLVSRNLNIVSEIFDIRDDVSDYLRLEYRNSSNMMLSKGIVDFSDDFTFFCYLPTQIGKPEYAFEEEATERMGYSFIECQMSKKVYKFVFCAPEYLCDALRIVRLCDTKKITSLGSEYELTSFEMGVKWEPQGDVAGVECSFETDTVISTVGGFLPASKVNTYTEKENG